MRTNEQLLELYNKKMPLLKKSLDEYNENTKDKATNPLLIKVSEKWEDSEVKIMIIGQETYTWCGECGNEGIFSANIKESLNIYNRFFLNNYGYTSPFWNEFRRLSKSIKTNKKVDFSWNNVIKIGRIGAGNIPNINDIIYKDFNAECITNSCLKFPVTPFKKPPFIFSVLFFVLEFETNNTFFLQMFNGFLNRICKQAQV